jgi:dienelactone hydrolase
VPVALKKGANDVYVAGSRGGFRLTLSVPNGLAVDPSRTVEPDRVEGEKEPGPRSTRAWNTTTQPIAGAVPLGVVTLTGASGGSVEGPALKVDAPRRRTFVSDIDGSVQSYALVPPAKSDLDKSTIGLVLSLHGAGVDCMDQARAYAPKPDFWIVCPTNRGRYGFDWQDWGREDAYEVLADVKKVLGDDWSGSEYLTGHSMGGHGTWHIAANDPYRFTAIAPSAGWSGFDSYGNANAPVTRLGSVWRAADGASRTMELIENLAQIETYVLHGEKDDNVPASEAHAMLDALKKAGAHPESHFEPDAGHWWDKDEKRPGADCVDWPGIFDLFRKHPYVSHVENEFSTTWTEPPRSELRRWCLAARPLEYGRRMRVVQRMDDEQLRLTVTTENVRSLKVSYGAFLDDGEKAEVVIDGQSFPWAAKSAEDFERVGDKWKQGVVAQRGEKTIARQGPFKRAFMNRFVLVYGTAGDDAEDRELLEKARYDSCVWAYRANGDANLMSDAQFLAGDFKDRNVIVYGNADTNSAWKAVFDDDCPIQAKRGVMTVNGAKHEGVVAAAFVRPRKGSDRALAAAFADTGAAATRLFYAFPVFSSGVGIPDYVVFGPGYLKELDGDVRAAGWFDWAWRMK